MKKIKVAIIGVGSIAQSHISAYLSDDRCELYAFCDIDEQRLKCIGEKHGVTHLYTDKDEMLKDCPEIDVVSVCTWNNSHAECSIAALNAGKNVLCEKPMAMNAQEAQAMKEAADRNGKLLMIGFVRRYGNDTKVIKDFIDNGDFGDIYYTKATYLRRAGAPKGWFCNSELSGGGPLIDLGVHVIDLARYLSGGPKPVSVYAATFNKLGNREHLKFNTRWGIDSEKAVFDVEDLATALIRFDNGMVMALEASFSLNIKEDVGTVQLFGDKAGAIIGSEIELFTEKNGYLTNTSLKCTTDSSFMNGGMFFGEIHHFLDCVCDKVDCISPAQEGVLLMKILDAAYKSARLGHEVEIE